MQVGDRQIAWQLPCETTQWAERVRRITRCRICGNSNLEPVIDLGAQTLASLFDDGRKHNQLETPIPLALVQCRRRAGETACGFVQLTHTVPPNVLYADYGYRSGINTTMRNHLEALVREVESTVPLRAGDIVLDIGANDGTMLLAYKTEGIVRVGFEPSNVRPGSAEHDLVYIPSVFSAAEFLDLFPGRQARIVTSIAMFYDLDDPMQFCRELHEILADNGVWVLEMSYLRAMLQHNTFDAICHEHLGYYSLRTLQHVIQQAGFVFYDITWNRANGGSIRCYLRKACSRASVPQANHVRIEQALQAEYGNGYDEQQAIEQFRSDVTRIRTNLQQQLEALRGSGKRIFGYGASTKGNVLLQYVGIGPQHLTAIADRNPSKVGRFTLGTKIPICSEDEMRQARPDFLLVLPWHFLEEFLEREAPLRASGTRFIVPFPHVRIV